jgi:hypothetical protein
MTLAPIEILAVELLQDIFLRSLNLSLPDASPHIAAKLAHPLIYNAVCTTYLTLPVDDEVRTDIRSKAELRHVQLKIFGYRWMTGTYFQSFMSRQAGCVSSYDSHSIVTFPVNYAHWPSVTRFSDHHRAAFVTIRCPIPVKLLHGPWTDSKVSFLRFLLWATAMTVDWGDKDTRKLVLEGKTEAFLTNNLAAVALFNHNRRLTRPPRLETVRFAVIEAGCDRSVVYNTMEAAIDWGSRLDSSEDTTLDMWCEQAIAAGNPKGNWLKLKLKEARTSRLDPWTGGYQAEGDKLVLAPR